MTDQINQIKSRLFFLDNLKVLVVMLVIVHHAALAYGIAGMWYVQNSEYADNLKYLFTLDRSFFMSLFFLISAYFIPASLERKGNLKYLIDRVVRLGIPILFFLVIFNTIPIYFYYLHHSGHGFISFWQFYFQVYWGLVYKQQTSAVLLQLWFISLLLALSICYVLFHNLYKYCKKASDFTPSHGGRVVKIIAYLKTWSLNQILWFAIAVIIIFSFVVRIWFPIGQWLNYVVFDVMPADFVRDTVFFTLGIVSYHRNLFFTISKKQGYTWLAIAFCLAVFYVAFGLTTGVNLFEEGGFSLVALRYDIWEAIFCTGMCIGLPVLFREVFNWTNKIWHMLAQDAFAAYLFHLLIVIGVQYCFVQINLAPVAKFFVVSCISIPLTFLICHYIRKII